MKKFRINCFLCNNEGLPILSSRTVFEIHASSTLRMFLNYSLPKMNFKYKYIHRLESIENNEFESFLQIWYQEQRDKYQFKKYFDLNDVVLSQRLHEANFASSAEGYTLNMLFEHKNLVENGSKYDCWPRENEWACEACTFLNRNYHGSDKCEICETERNEKISVTSCILENATKNLKVFKIPFKNYNDGNVMNKSKDKNLIPLAPQATANLPTIKPRKMSKLSNCNNNENQNDDPIYDVKQVYNEFRQNNSSKMETDPQNPTFHEIDSSNWFDENANSLYKFNDYLMPDDLPELELVDTDDMPELETVNSSSKSIGNESQNNANTIHGANKSNTAVHMLALLSGGVIGTCTGYIASLSDVDVNNNSKSSKKKGSTNLTLNDLKMLAMTIRSDIEKKFIESLQERSMIKKDIVGEICDKVTQRFVYGEKNVVYNDCWTAMSYITGTMLFSNRHDNVGNGNVDNIHSVTQNENVSVYNDDVLAQNSKLFLKDCLINVISHLLTQSKVVLGSEEALEIVGCIKCFIYIASSEISEANYRCLGLYAEILYPKHALYDCLHGDIGTNELNIQTKNWGTSHLQVILDMDKSEVQPAVLDISSRHTIDACLKISIESGTYGVIHNLLKSGSWIGLPSYHSILRIILYSKECLNEKYVIHACESVMDKLENIESEILLKEAVLSVHPSHQNNNVNRSNNSNSNIAKKINVLVQILETLMHLSYWNNRLNNKIALQWLNGVVLKFFKSNNLQRRLFAVDALNSWCKNVATSQPNKKYTKNFFQFNSTNNDRSYCSYEVYVEWIREHRIIEKIFERDRLRVEIIDRCKELLSFLIKFKEYTNKDYTMNASQAFHQQDLELIWNSSIGRDTRTIKNIAMLIVFLVKDISESTLQPIFQLWSSNVIKYEKELTILMSTFASENFSTLFPINLVQYVVRILWNLIINDSLDNRKTVLVSMLNRLMDSQYEKANEHKEFVYKKCLVNLLKSRNSTDTKNYMVFLNILEDNVIGTHGKLSGIFNIALASNVKKRIKVLDEICVMLHQADTNLFNGSNRISLLGVLLQALKHNHGIQEDSHTNSSATVIEYSTYDKIVKCLFFLDKVSRNYERSSKLGGTDVLDLWISLSGTHDGREAMYFWLGTTNFSINGSESPFQEGTRENIFQNIICKASAFRTLSERGYTCFYEHLIEINVYCNKITMSMNNVTGVHCHAYDLVGYESIWELIMKGRKSVVASALNLYVTLFYALKAEMRIEERNHFLQKLLTSIKEFQTDGRDRERVQWVKNCIMFLKRMIQADNIFFMYNFNSKTLELLDDQKHDAEKKIRYKRIRTHDKSGRGTPLRLTVIYDHKMRQNINNSTNNMLEKFSYKTVANIESNDDDTSSIVINVKMHTNVFLVELRKTINVLLNNRINKQAMLTSRSNGINTRNVNHVLLSNNYHYYDDYRKLKLTVKGKTLIGADLYLDDSSILLQDGDEIYACYTLMNQEGATFTFPNVIAQTLKPNKEAVQTETTTTSTSLTDTFVTMESKITLKSGSTKVIDDTLVPEQDFTTFGRKEVWRETPLSKLVQLHESFYNIFFSSLLQKNIIEKWKLFLWKSIISFPSWQEIVDQITNPLELNFDSITSSDLQYCLLVYILIAVRAKLIPASDHEFQNSKKWRQKFVEADGFEFLLKIFDIYDSQEASFLKQRCLADVLHCIKFLVLGSLHVSSFTSVRPQFHRKAVDEKDNDYIESNNTNNQISPPRVGKMFEEDSILFFRQFDKSTADTIMKSVQVKELVSNLLDIIIGGHKNDALFNDKAVMMDALHAVEEIIRSMPSQVMVFNKMIIDKDLISVATENSSTMIRRASSAVIKSIWQCLNLNGMSDIPSVTNALQERNNMQEADMLLSQNIIDNLLRIDLNGDAHFYEISNAINYHIKYCTVLPNEDNIELLAPTPTNNGNTLGQNISLINVVDKSTNWQLVLEELLYKLADGFDEMVFLSDSTSSVKLSNVKKKTQAKTGSNFILSLEGILCNLVALGHAGDDEKRANVNNVAESLRISKALLRYIVDRGLFYIPSDQTQDPRRSLCRTKKTRKLAFQLLINNVSMYPEIRDTVLNKVSSLYNIACVDNAKVQDSSNYKINWKYDPSNAELPSHGFCGLTNQGATCYINSLLQQFFMCEKIRDGVLYNKDQDLLQANDRKILKELQRLFAFLQCSEAKSYNTTNFVETCRELELTNDVLSQNDTAEFCDKLIDHLETALQSTWQTFTGSIMHETDFLGVPYRSERKQKIACLQLPIIGNSKSTLKQSLDSFIKAEKMEGENQVECHEAGNKKFDALRRDWLSILPQLLIVHLKRWELDYQTFVMKKNNNYCQFPIELDMTPYVKTAANSQSNGINASSKYVLSGVLIHRGPAGGGHYYSIIKDRRTGEWYKFNDEVVARFDINTIDEESFGKAGSDQSAYMLFYERIDTCSEAKNTAESTREEVNAVDTKINEGYVVSLQKELSSFNSTFLQKQILFDTELSKFLYDDMCQFDYSIAQYKLAIRYFFGVIMRSYHTSVLKSYSKHLQMKIRSNFEIAKWTLYEIICPNYNDPNCTLVLNHLLECNEEEKRQVLSKIIVATMIGVQTQQRLKKDVVLNDTVRLCMKHLVNMMWDAAKNWRKCHSYFKTLELLFKLTICTEMLLRTTDIVPRLVHYFLGDCSTNMDYPKLLSWNTAGKTWDYATDPPDRILPLKVLVIIFENLERSANNDYYNNPLSSFYSMQNDSGVQNETPIVNELYKKNKSCGFEFYNYATTSFDKDSTEYKLVNRIAMVESVDLHGLSEKHMLSKITNDNGDIRIGCDGMYRTNMHAAASVFVTDFKIPYDGTISSARICASCNERPMNETANDFNLLVLEEQNLEDENIVFDDGTSIDISRKENKNKAGGSYRQQQQPPHVEVREFQPGNAIKAMKFDLKTGEGGDFENGFIKAAYPETKTYDVLFVDGTLSTQLLGDFISMSDEPYKKEHKSYKIVRVVPLPEFSINRTDIQVITGLDCEIKKGQYIGIANHSGSKLWLSWEDKWKKSDTMHFKTYFTCTHSNHISKNVGSTLFSLRQASCRAQYSFFVSTKINSDENTSITQSKEVQFCL